MMRSALGVIAGYVVFGVPSGLLFYVTGVDPHVMPSTQFLVFSTIFGMVFAFAGGYAAARIAARRPRLHGAALAALIVVIAAGSMLAQFHSSSVWSQTVALAFLAPSALAGGVAAA